MKFFGFKVESNKPVGYDNGSYDTICGLGISCGGSWNIVQSMTIIVETILLEMTVLV